MFAYLSNGIRIFYEDRGKYENKTIILIHHLAGSINSWKYITPILSEKFRVLVYDLRGHGRSSIPPGPYKIEEHSEDLKGLIEELGIEDPIIVGHSIGSLIAIDYALNNYVKKLILIGALYKAPNPEPYQKYVSIAMNLGMVALAEYRRSQGELSNSLINNPTLWKDFINIYNENTPLGYKYAVEGLLSAKDYSKELQKIDSNVLLIYGDEDKLSANVTVFQQNIRNLTVQTFKGYGHFLNLEEPKGLIEAIVNFV
ncbi:alpha/beta fold hydrolase [Sulfurisphaera ohwakuensis]|uniref:alpha/beta fold hydrolase n=1 Tax=Sulfurisphaera ohwakuensis TaxID=69656 RepID=UPI0036F2A290